MKKVVNHDLKAYEFSHFLPNSYLISLLTHTNNTSRLWHVIFGHVNFKYIQQLHNENMVKGSPLIKYSKGVCTSCLVEKHPERRYEVGNKIKDASTLDLIHSDISILIHIEYMNGSRYFLTFIDDYSRYCWICFLKQKFEVFETFKIFKSLVENTLQNIIKEPRFDNGGEYVKIEF